MSGIRNVVLAEGEIYHVFNRGVDRREIFIDKRDYERTLDILNFYRFTNLPLRYSFFMKLAKDQREVLLASLHELEVTILAFCLMPNHFHIVLRQEKENGITRFLANFTNSFVRYSNTKHGRVGPLLEGVFKAVRVESNEQLLHVVRYVHLNPVVGFVIKESQLDTYPWSSHKEYLGHKQKKISDPSLVLSQFKDEASFNGFVHDQISYAKELNMIQHLTLGG